MTAQYDETFKNYYSAHLMAYPPQLAPAATARSGSTSGKFSRTYFHPFCKSTNGLLPQFLRIASVSSKVQEATNVSATWPPSKLDKASP